MTSLREDGGTSSYVAGRVTLHACLSGEDLMRQRRARKIATPLRRCPSCHYTLCGPCIGRHSEMLRQNSISRAKYYLCPGCDRDNLLPLPESELTPQVGCCASNAWRYNVVCPDAPMLAPSRRCGLPGVGVNVFYYLRSAQGSLRAASQGDIRNPPIHKSASIQYVVCNELSRLDVILAVDAASALHKRISSVKLRHYSRDRGHWSESTHVTSEVPLLWNLYGREQSALFTVDIAPFCVIDCILVDVTPAATDLLGILIAPRTLPHPVTENQWMDVGARPYFSALLGCVSAEHGTRGEHDTHGVGQSARDPSSEIIATCQVSGLARKWISKHLLGCHTLFTGVGDKRCLVDLLQRCDRRDHIAYLHLRREHLLEASDGAAALGLTKNARSVVLEKLRAALPHLVENQLAALLGGHGARETTSTVVCNGDEMETLRLTRERNVARVKRSRTVSSFVDVSSTSFCSVQYFCGKSLEPIRRLVIVLHDLDTLLTCQGMGPCVAQLFHLLEATDAPVEVPVVQFLVTTSAGCNAPGLGKYIPSRIAPYFEEVHLPTFVMMTLGGEGGDDTMDEVRPSLPQEDDAVADEASTYPSAPPPPQRYDLFQAFTRQQCLFLRYMLTLATQPLHRHSLPLQVVRDEALKEGFLAPDRILKTLLVELETHHLVRRVGGNSLSFQNPIAMLEDVSRLIPGPPGQHGISNKQ